LNFEIKSTEIFKSQLAVAMKPLNHFHQQMSEILQPLNNLQLKIDTLFNFDLPTINDFTKPLFDHTLFDQFNRALERYKQKIIELDFTPELFDDMPVSFIFDAKYIETNIDNLKRRYWNKDYRAISLLVTWIDSIDDDHCPFAKNLLLTLRHIKNCIEPHIDKIIEEDYPIISLTSLLLAVHLQQIIQDSHFNDAKMPKWRKDIFDKRQGDNCIDHTFAYCYDIYFSNVEPFTEAADTSRHGICHGKSVGYGTIENLTRYFTLIEFFISSYNHNKRIPCNQ
jgi:hypothetical protein